MPSITGSFSGKITKQSAMPLNDQPNHELGIAEMSGTQKSADPLWDNASITYWGVTQVSASGGAVTVEAAGNSPAAMASTVRYWRREVEDGDEV
jgi:hypothetical protein